MYLIYLSEIKIFLDYRRRKHLKPGADSTVLPQLLIECWSVDTVELITSLIKLSSSIK